MDINKPRNQAEQLIQAGLKKIARDLARIDKRVNIIERASQSKFRSVSGGSTYYYDTDGNVRQVLGAQEDGTYTVTDVNGPPPDQAPSAPILETRDATLIVTWDGKMANGSTLWPADFSHVEVHVSTEDNFAVSDDTEISSLHGKIGESVSISLVGSTEYYVRLAAVNTSGNRSAASADVSVIVEDIETGIKTFRQDDAPTGLDSDNYGYLWYDTNDGNKLYFWDGVAWVETTDASVAEASTLASTAYDLADDAFTAAQAAQASADGAIRTYYASDPPWANGSSQPADVLGDMWFDEDDGQAYRWNGSSWVIIEDSSIAVALAAAQNAQTTADGKITAYYQDTAPTVGDLGDLWYDTNDQNKPYYCSSISPLTWTLIRDAGITTAQATADQAVADAADAQATADGKTRSYFQTTAPTGLTAADVGDMWFDSDDGFKMYRWDGDSWEVSADTRISDALTAANNAQTIANGKITTFYQTSPPVSTAIGDLWVDTDDGNKLYRALMVGADAIAGGEWVSVQDTGIASAAAAAAAASATAAAAQSDADQALADAADAQATADGKMRTFFQAAAPTGMVAGDIGDLWFDTDDGNKLYRWDGSAWVVSQDQALAAELEAYIQSRGTDLVTNGTGLLGNNTNFSWSTFRADDAPVGASGSFMSSFGGQVRFTDEVIPVDPAKKYVLSAWVRETTTETDSRAYTGFAPYDAYGLSINPQHYMFRGGTTTTLAAPLNPGDTTITLTSAANWKVTAGASSHWRNIIFWDYIDAGGKAWPAETYSRNFLSDAYADGGITGNVITLKVPYAGTARAAGTSLSNGGSGGTYIYSGMSNTLVVPEWTNYKSATPITGLHDPTGGVIGGDPTSATASWPQGTATTKVAFLMNRTVAAPSNNPNARQSFAGISLSDASAAQVTADRKITTFYQAGVPTALSIGDLWVDTDDGNKLYRALSVGANAITAGEWVSVQDTAIAAAATAASTAQSAANAAQSAAATAQATADGATVTYYASTFPWANSSGQVSSKEGDLFFDTDDKTVWRWSHSTQTWVQIKDPDISAALSAAQNAQTTADGKITAYYQTSAPAGAETGDLWYDTDDQNKPYYWDGDSWELIRDGGVTTALSQITSLTTDLNNLETSVDGKTTTYFSDNAPWANGTAGHEVDAGDLWFDTNDKNKMYRWVEPGKTWTLSDDQRISETLVIANGKITTFYQAAVPTSTATGDLWVDTDDGNKLYRAAMVGANEITAGEWVLIQDSAGALSAANTALTTANGKNKVIYSTATPGSTANTIGDVWFQRDSVTGNIIKHFEGLGGTSWTLRELSHETIASIDIGKATVGELQGQFIAGDAIDGKTITSAVIRTADSPTRVQIDADGLTQWVNDVVVTKIGETNLFTGDIDATTMQIQDQLALRGVNNIFAKGSKVTLQSNQTAPNQPLSLTVSYEEATAPGSLYYATVGAHLDASELNPAYAGNLLGQGVFRRGANYYSWPTITLPNGSTRSSYEVSRYTRIFYGGVEQAVSIMAYWTTASNLPEGIYLYTHNDAGMNTSGTTAPTVTSTLRLSDFNWSHDFALGRVFDTSGTANRDKFAYAFAQKSVDDTTWSMYGAILQPNGSGGYNTVHSTSIASFPRLGTDENLTGVNYGSSSRMQFHGADQFVWVFSTNKWNYVYNLNGTVRLTDLEFPTAQSNAYRVFTIGSLSAGDFNGFRTMALQTSSHKMYRYTDITWTGDGTASDANAVWWARYRWRNKTTEATMRQTPHGPTQYVIMKKRAMLSVTSPSIPPPAAGVGATRSAPDDVWTFRYFLGKGATEPATSAMWLQSTQPGDLVTSVKLLTSPLTSGTALNAAFTAFTGSLPSEIISSDIDGFGQPLLKLAGDGSARVSALEAASLNVTAWNSADVAWTNLSNTLAVGAVQYRVKAGWVCVTVIATAATASGTTYTVTTAQLPSALRPDRNIRGACDFSGFPGTIVANSAGNILLAHNSGANRATIEGFVTWPVQ